MDLHSHKNIQIMDFVLDTWHSDKRKGLKVKVTTTLLEFPATLNLLNLPGGHAMQALSTQLETLIEAITGQSKKGKAFGDSATAIQHLNLLSIILNKVMAKNGGPLIAFQ